MHLHVDHDLFFERRRPLWVAAGALVLTTAVLTVNAGAPSPMVSLVGASAGAALLLRARARGQRRIKPALAWAAAIVAVAVLGPLALGLPLERLLPTGVRVLCGVLWILWLGTQVDWASLRQLMSRAGMPDGVVASLDHALMHGVLTQQAWIRRRDAARLRLGSPHLPLPAWGPILGEGALDAFARLESTEENALLRRASSAEVDSHDGLHLEGVTVERGGHLVLEQLGLRVDNGEWLLVCGPSGAGKSSLLRLLAGLDAPVQGSVVRFGRTMSAKTPLNARLDGRVALLSQNPEHHFIASTVGEDIAWGLRGRGVETGEADRRSRDMAHALRIDHLLERPCHQLSFGEQRRAALAGLLVLEPALLLLDEPTAGLDPVATGELTTLVEESVHRSGAACVWATHDLHALPSFAERVVLIKDRRLLFDGPTADGLSPPWLSRAGLAISERG